MKQEKARDHQVLLHINTMGKIILPETYEDEKAKEKIAERLTGIVKTECYVCTPRCGNCANMGAWDRHGKPYVCESCTNASNWESDELFCSNCGSPLTEAAKESLMCRFRRAIEIEENTN